MLRRGFLQMALATGRDPVWISAHRGAMRFAPENTIAAYEKAAAFGAEFVEVDVRTTRDGTLVIMHDAQVDRTTDGQGAIADLTLAEVRRLRPAVPTFAEVLAWGKRRGVRIDVDHKAASVEAIAREIRQAGMTKRVVIEGPRERLSQFVALLPGVDTMPKVSAPEEIAGAQRELSMRTVRLRLTQLVKEEYTRAARAAGVRISVTILGEQDTAETMRTVIRQGARLIETDYPDVAALVRVL